MGGVATRWKPGARVRWWHYLPDGRVLERAGVVWDGAPAVPGAQVVVWVVPDQPLPGDLYCVLAVGKATGRINPHGPHENFDDTLAGTLAVRDARVAAGRAFASGWVGSPTGQLAAAAAEAAAVTATQH